MKKVFCILILIVVAFQSINIVSADVSSNAIQKDTISSYIDGASSKEVVIESLNGHDENIIICNESKLTITNTIYGVIESNFTIADYTVIEDIDDDGIKDIVLAMASTNEFPNMYVYSGATGQLIYNYRLATTMDHESLGVTVHAYELTQVIALHNNNVAIISDYSVYLFDVVNQELVGSYFADNNIWTVKNLDDNNFIIGSQDGMVVALSSETAKVKWKRQLTDKLSFTHERVAYKLDINVYDMLVAHEKVYVTTQDGKLHILDMQTGQTYDIQVIADIDEETMKQFMINNTVKDTNGKIGIYPLSKEHQDFFNYTLLEAGDNVLVISNFGNKYNGTSGKSLRSDLKQSILQLYNASKKEIVSNVNVQKKDITFTKPFISINESGNEVIGVIDSRGNNSLELKFFSASNLELVSTKTVQFSTAVSSRLHLIPYQDRYILQDIGKDSYYVDKELTQVTTSVNAGLSIGVYKVNSDEYYLLGVGDNVQFQSFSYYPINGIDKKWTFDAQEYDFSNIYGFWEYSDHDGDGLQDFIGIARRYNNYLSSLVVFEVSSKDGKIINELSINEAYINKYIDSSNLPSFFKSGYYNLEVGGDYNNDGYDEIILNNVIILDGKSKKFLHYFGQIEGYNDVNNDGVVDRIEVINGMYRVMISNISCTTTSCSINYTPSGDGAKYINHKNDKMFIKHSNIGDYNFDGVQDVAVSNYDDNGIQFYSVHSGVDFTHLFDIHYNDEIIWGSYIIPLGVDLDGDGISELMTGYAIGEGYDIFSSKDLSKITSFTSVHSGEWGNFNRDVEDKFTKGGTIENPVYFNNNKQLAIYVLSFNTYFVDDQNGDGVKDFLICGTSIENGNKMPYIYLYSYDSLEPIKKVNMMTYYNYGDTYSTGTISSVMSFSRIENSDSKFGIHTQSGSILLYDINNFDSIISLGANVTSLYELSENSLIFNSLTKDRMFSAAVNVISDYSYLKFNNFTDGQTIKSGYKLNVDTQSNKLVLLKAFYKGQAISYSTSNSLELFLPEGAQEVIIVGYSDTGTVMTKTINVIVKKSMVTSVLHAIMALLFIAVIYILANSKKYRNRYWLGGRK